MVKVKYLEGRYVYYPCTPSRWVGEPSVEFCLQLTIASERGMGGSKWSRFVKPMVLDVIPSNQLVKFFDIVTGEALLINTSFIVEIQERNFVKVSYRSDNEYVGKGNKNLYFCTDKDNNNIALINKYRMISEYTSKI